MWSPIWTRHAVQHEARRLPQRMDVRLVIDDRAAARRPVRMQLTFAGAIVVRFEYEYVNGLAGVASAGSVHTSSIENVDARLERGAIGLAAHTCARLRHRFARVGRERTNRARERDAGAGAPAYAALNAVLRPCERLLVGT